MCESISLCLVILSALKELANITRTVGETEQQVGIIDLQQSLKMQKILSARFLISSQPEVPGKRIPLVQGS